MTLLRGTSYWGGRAILTPDRAGRAKIKKLPIVWSYWVQDLSNEPLPIALPALPGEQLQKLPSLLYDRCENDFIIRNYDYCLLLLSSFTKGTKFVVGWCKKEFGIWMLDENICHCIYIQHTVRNHNFLGSKFFPKFYSILTSKWRQ